MAHLNENKQVEVERSSKLSDESRPKSNTKSEMSLKSLPTAPTHEVYPEDDGDGEEEESQPISPTISKLNETKMVKKAKERIIKARTPENDPDEPISPGRQRLDGSGLTQRVTDKLRSESEDRVGSRPPSRQNDTEEVVAQGALLRAAESFGSSLQRARNRISNENDAHHVAVKGNSFHIPHIERPSYSI